MYGKGGADTLQGFGNTPGWEEGLSGQDGNDRLYGGGLTGDHYVFDANNWGNDTVTDGASGIRDNTVQIPSAVSVNLAIDLRSDRYLPEVTNEGNTRIVNWSGNIIDEVVNQGSGDYRITSNDDANRISSVGFDPEVGVISAGEDTILAGGGNDNVNVADGVGDDNVDCGGGTGGVVMHDPGDTLVPNTCETAFEE